MSGCPSEDWRKCSNYLIWRGIAHRIFSTCRPPNHPLSKKNPRSDHIKGLALDTDWSDRIWNTFEPLALGPDRVVKQLIKSPQGSITNGRRGGQIPGHWDHVHVASSPGAEWPHERAQFEPEFLWYPQRNEDDDMQAKLEPDEEWVFPLYLGKGNPDFDKLMNTFSAFLKLNAVRPQPARVIWGVHEREGRQITQGELVIDLSSDSNWASTPEAAVYQAIGNPEQWAGSVRVQNTGDSTVIVTCTTYEGVVR